MVNLVPATAEHVQALYGKSLPVTIFGIAGVEGDRVLLVDSETRELQWTPMATVRFAKIINPESPKPVIPVQVQQSPRLAVPDFRGGLN